MYTRGDGNGRIKYEYKRAIILRDAKINKTIKEVTNHRKFPRAKFGAF